MRDATRKETKLEGADPTDAALARATLGGVSLRNASAAHANLEGARPARRRSYWDESPGGRLTDAKLHDRERLIAELVGAELGDVVSTGVTGRRS